MRSTPLKIIAMIPARYNASRFPRKMMADLGGKPVIVRTYEATLATGLFDAVYVVTDSTLIKKAIEAVQGKVIMSKKEHPCGSDRIAAAVMDLEVDIVVNVQGDEPFVKKKPLELLLACFHGADAQKIDLASLMQKIEDPRQINDPNYVKVLVDQHNFALYFSRAAVPYAREKCCKINYYEHIGVYAFRKKALVDFYQLPMGTLEAAEKIECIRYLEYGKKIKMVITDYMGIEIDTPEDLKKATRHLKNSTV